MVVEHSRTISIYTISPGTEIIASQGLQWIPGILRHDHSYGGGGGVITMISMVYYWKRLVVATGNFGV